MSRRLKWLEKRAPWVPHGLEMLQSPSWRHAPIPLRRVLERLEIEHMRHGGQLNGELRVAYKQFVDANVSRRVLPALLRVGEELGLIGVVRPTEPTGDLRAPHLYRLTYLPAIGCSEPGDEWKRVTEERAMQLVEAFRDSYRTQTKAERSVAA